MKTGTLLLLTVLFLVGGLILVGGGIAYLIWDKKKERKAAQRRALRNPMQTMSPTPVSQKNNPSSK